MTRITFLDEEHNINITHLCLHMKNLTVIPRSIKYLIHLKHLNISYNNLTELPKAIKYLKS